jgi:hypothetical protein
MKVPITGGEEKNENEVSEEVSTIIPPSDAPTAVNASNADEANAFNRDTNAAEESVELDKPVDESFDLGKSINDGTGGNFRCFARNIFARTEKVEAKTNNTNEGETMGALEKFQMEMFRRMDEANRKAEEDKK